MGKGWIIRGFGRGLYGKGRLKEVFAGYYFNSILSTSKRKHYGILL